MASGDDREDLAARVAAAVAEIYRAVEDAILKAVAAFTIKATSGALVAAVAARRLRQTLQAILSEASQHVRTVLRSAAQETRQAAAQTVRQDLAHAPGQVTARAVAEALSAPAAAEWQALPTRLQEAGLNALRDADDVYRDAVEKAMQQRTAIGEAVRDLEGPERALRSQSRVQVAQTVLDDFAERGVTGFVDRAGRAWDLAAYAEMATRTATSRMHLQLQLAAMGPPGFDLVIVDNPSRAAPCPRCRPFEGRVLSLTGRTTGEASATDADGQTHTVHVAGTVAEARAAGLLHPACRHSLLPFVNGAGLMPLVGGPDRPFIEHGRPEYEPLPVGTLADYANEQKLRAHERRVRAAKRAQAVATTRQAKTAARRRIATAQARLEEHVAKTGVIRQHRRERIGVAR